MRRKLKTDSTMKTITYGLFIYMSLTTFNGIPSAVALIEPREKSPIQIDPKCDLASIIKKSKYAGECANIKTNASLPELVPLTSAQYLCTGISETVDKICESNSTPITVTSFEEKIEKSRTVVGGDLEKFCSRLNDSISKAYKDLTITRTAHPNIIKFNQTFMPVCGNYCFGGKNPVAPLCVVLYWLTGVAVSPEDHGPNSNQPKETLKEKLGDSLSSQAAQSDAAKPAPSTPKTPTISRGDNKNSSKTPINDIIKEHHTELVKPPQDRTGPADSSQIAGEHNNPAKIEKGGKSKKTMGVDTAAQTGSGDKAKGNNQIKTPKSETAEPPPRDNDSQGGAQSNTGAGEKDEPSSDDVFDNDMSFNTDEAVTGPKLSETSDSSLAIGKNGEESNHGKKAELGGKKTADTVEDSIAPPDHNLVHSEGPPDPPQHFFAYFMAVSFICIVCYIGYHKKHKIMGIIFEGRKSRAGRGRRRPNTAGYRKLDCNLEEAVTSQCNSNVTHVIY